MLKLCILGFVYVCFVKYYSIPKSSKEVAIPLAAVLMKLLYPAANPGFLWRWKAFLFSDLAVDSEN